MHDGAVTRERSFDSVVTVIGMVRISPFMHMLAHGVKIENEDCPK